MEGVGGRVQFRRIADKSPTLRPACAPNPGFHGRRRCSFGGTSVSQNHRPPVRLFPKLATQLVPAAVVTALGALLLSNLGKSPVAISATAPVPAAIRTEAVFTATPRLVEQPRLADEEPVRANDVARPAAKPKAVAAIAAPARKPADEPRQVEPRQVAVVSAPLAITPPTAQPQPPEPSVLGRVWGATTSVAGMPIRAAQSVTGWFGPAVPPRPPAPVPLQQFEAAM